MKTQSHHISLPKLIVLFALHCLLDTCIHEASSHVVLVKDLYSMIQLVKISHSLCSRSKDVPHIRTHVWLKIWTLTPTPASVTLLAAYPNESGLLFVLGEEDGEFVIIVRTGFHEVEVLVAE